MRAFATSVSVAILAVSVTGSLGAQSSAGQLIDRARSHIENYQFDSASALLQRALDPSEGATQTERIRGLELFAVSELSRDPPDAAAARQALESILRLEAGYVLPDSIADLQSDMRLVFAQARQLVPLPVAPLGLTVTLLDTLAAPGGSIGFRVEPTRTARLQIEVTPADSTRVIWQDSALAGGPTRIGWPVSQRSRELLADGRYALRAVATDAAGTTSALQQLVLAVRRIRPDTQALPVPPPVLPETAYSNRASPAVLLGGLALAGAAVFLPTAMGNADLNTGLEPDASAYAVGGAIAIGTIVGWVTGRRQNPIPDNIDQNQRNQAWYAQRRAQVSQANERARSTAGLRIQTEGARP